MIVSEAKEEEDRMELVGESEGSRTSALGISVELAVSRTGAKYGVESMRKDDIADTDPQIEEVSVADDIEMMIAADNDSTERIHPTDYSRMILSAVRLPANLFLQILATAEGKAIIRRSPFLYFVLYPILFSHSRCHNSAATRVLSPSFSQLASPLAALFSILLHLISNLVAAVFRSALSTDCTHYNESV